MFRITNTVDYTPCPAVQAGEVYELPNSLPELFTSSFATLNNSYSFQDCVFLYSGLALHNSIVIKNLL